MELPLATGVYKGIPHCDADIPAIVQLVAFGDEISVKLRDNFQV